jgi:hypothetical protein
MTAEIVVQALGNRRSAAPGSLVAPPTTIVSAGEGGAHFFD